MYLEERKILLDLLSINSVIFPHSFLSNICNGYVILVSHSWLSHLIIFDIIMLLNAYVTYFVSIYDVGYFFFFLIVSQNELFLKRSIH